MIVEQLSKGGRATRDFYNDIDVGFCIIELRFDEQTKKVSDYRFLEINDAFAHHSGLQNALGQLMRNLAPTHEQFWFDRYAEIARTGRPARFEYTAQALGGRHFEVYAYRVGEPEQQQVAILFADISIRKVEDDLRSALIELNDRLADCSDIGRMTDVACGIIGRTLGVQLVGYGIVDPVADTIMVERDWFTGPATSLAGLLRFRDFGSYVDDLKRGDTVIVTDVRLDPRTEAYAEALEHRSARAFVNTPLFEQGRFVALQYVSTNRPRAWTEGELQFIREVATRLRAATARRAVEARLRESEERLRFVIEGAKDYAIVTTDPAGLIVSWSAGAEAIFGWTAAEAVGQPIALIFTPEDQAQGVHIAEMSKAEREGVASDVRWHITKDGHRVFMNGSVHPLPKDSGGRERGFIKIARDETQRRQVDEALRESEARYHNLFDTIDEGFCVIRFIDGPHGPFGNYVHVEANPAFEHHLGIAHVSGQTLRDIAPDAETGGWLKIYGDVLRTGQPVRFQREFAPTRRFLEVAAHRIEPASRREVAVLFTDITARKQAETNLRASEALARENIQRVQLALAAGAIIGTWFWDIPRDRFTIDEAFARSFGLDPALGREGIPLAQIVATVHPDDQAGLAEAISEAIARGGAYAHQYRVRRADGQYYWLEANGRVDHTIDGKPLSFPGVLIDVNDRRMIEAERDRAAAALRALTETLEQQVSERTAELMRAEAQLRQSQKMEAVGQLTGGLAHDFNNLLAVITGSLDLLSRRINQGRLNDVDRFITASQTAAKRATSLTHRLLAFSRRQTLDPQHINANTLIADMTDMVRRTVGPEITVDINGAADLWTTLVDPGQLENALLNLCINARDAMPEGGRIMIETTNKVLDARAAETRDLVPGEFVVISVTDTGTGMPPEVVARVFEPFYTTKPIGQGTGLGLSMVYGFARQSEGQVRIHSEVGKGTTISIYLPHAQGLILTAEEAPVVDLGRAEAGQTVLVVDDEQNVRMLVVDVLKELGYTAIEAQDGLAGLQVLRSDLRVDLLVTDVGMPGMNGRQLADAGRVVRPDLKVLFITGYAEAAVISHGHLEQGMAVVTKPFALDALATRIKTLIATR